MNISLILAVAALSPLTLSAQIFNNSPPPAMNPDTTTLLDELTATRSADADTLITALRVRRRHRAQLRTLTVSALLVAFVAGVLHFRPREKPVIVTTPGEAPPSTMLTKNELLDSFGDQPVALVTWPDGRQQLLAITHRPAPAIG